MIIPSTLSSSFLEISDSTFPYVFFSNPSSGFQPFCVFSVVPPCEVFSHDAISAVPVSHFFFC